jgi:hypothetical protein
MFKYLIGEKEGIGKRLTFSRACKYCSILMILPCSIEIETGSAEEHSG